MAVRGGLTRFARPCGAARSQARGLSNWLRQLSNPGRGFSSPPVENIKEKSPYFRTGSHLEYGGEGGIDSLRSPLRGSPLTACAVCPTGCASCRTPVGGPPPPLGRIEKKRARTFVQALISNMAVRGGFEPPIRCRIHTFQACSFSHSDTSPYCLSRCCRERALM